MIEAAGHFIFGEGGNASPFMAGGWSGLEPGLTWTDGRESRLRLPLHPGRGLLMLEIGLLPFTVHPVVRRQRLIVICNGVTIAEESLGGEATLGITIPPAAIGTTGTLDLVLQCPDAVAPRHVSTQPDPRCLGVAVSEILLLWTPERPAFKARTLPPLPAQNLHEAVRGMTGLSVPDLAKNFESLGRNCEFGLAQRRMGIDPLGLLRFASIPPTRLLQGLDLGFDGIEALDNLRAYTNDDEPGSEVLVRDARYGVQFHTGKPRGDASDDATLQTAARTIGFLRNRLIEDLQTGRKIFVFQNTGTTSLAQAWPLINMLRDHGPNTLLFVTEGRTHPAGMVEQIEPDLLHGHVARLAPAHDVESLILEPWISLCANAYRFWREVGRGRPE